MPVNLDMSDSIFSGRNLVIATMHAKELVIAPILEEKLGVTCSTISDINTDTLGTFTGEIERKLSPLEAAREKCKLALQATGFDLAVASEGSFGAHPEIFFAKADEEIVLLLDTKNDLEIVARILSTNTNFDGQEINSWRDLQQFAENALFPSHGLILRPHQNSHTNIVKGIKDWKSLERAFEEMQAKQGSTWVETDMRAMHNPTRLQVIQQATENLAQSALSLCPSCDAPGFGTIRTEKGLPCELCQSPTRSVKSIILGCQKCGFEESQPRTDGKLAEDPMYCDQCNP